MYVLGQSAGTLYLSELASQNGHLPAAGVLGILLAAALRAALTDALNGRTEAREALESLL